MAVATVTPCMSSALAAMHELGLVHLDVKPSNVLYVCGDDCSGATAMKFYLSDFGMCHMVGSAYKDEIGGVVGTHEYMDTLALEHKRSSRATDCFSLGCTLYELLVGARLYEPSCMDRPGNERVHRSAFASRLPQQTFAGHTISNASRQAAMERE